MSRLYRRKRKDGSWSPDLNLTVLMETIGQDVVQGHGPFQLTQDGEPIGPERTRLEVLEAFKKAIRHREIGPTFRIREDGGDVVVAARAVEFLNEEDTTNGNQHSDVLWNWVRDEFSVYQPRFAGSYVCKPDSQHRFGNADDVFFDSLVHQEKVVLASIEIHDQLSLAHVISQQRIWNPEVGWHPYDGEFHAHGHWDFLPNYDTNLPCGVRGLL